MKIRGFDQWLTTPPEELDWIQLAEKVQKAWSPKDENEAYLLQIIDGLMELLEE